MENYQIKRPASNKTRKRVGRGPGSGMGKTSTRGQKGQMSRSGSKSRPWFEGGQMPIQRRVPKRGFNNPTRVEYHVVNISTLAKLQLGEVTPDIMKKKGVLKKSEMKVKILGVGDISQPCTVTADAFSKSAIEKIEKAGGKTIVRVKVEKKKTEAV